MANFTNLTTLTNLTTAASCYCANCTTSFSCDGSDAGALLLPIFNESTWNIHWRRFLYLITLLWSFMGVSIGADLFMCSIEMITSKTKRIKVPSDTDSKGFEEIEVRVWNGTVANLTLMALGSSAPEILLSIIEIVGNKFKAGDLGPGTIVGSAAFNLFVITAVCIAAVPTTTVRSIRVYKVFMITAFFCIFAYIWLYIVLQVITVNVVDIWEAVITFLFFPMLVIIAYIADKEFCCAKVDSDKKKDIELGAMELLKEDYLSKNHPEVVAFMKEVTGNPRISDEEAAKLIAMRIESTKTKDYGYYRVGVLRSFGGGRKVVPRIQPKLQTIVDEYSEADDSHMSIVDIDGMSKAVVEFSASSVSVMENEKVVHLGIQRRGNVEINVVVHYETIDGTAEAGSDYIAKKELLQFTPGETHKYVDIVIIDDNAWEPDETFFVKLWSEPSDDGVKIGKHSIAEVTIINDDEPGYIEFVKPSFIYKESNGCAEVELHRVNGADGQVAVTWKTKDQTAVHGKDYIGGTGSLVFDHGETVKVLSLDLIDDKTFEKDETFLVTLSDPTGGATLGRLSRTVVTIVNDDDYRRMFDRVVSLTHMNLDKFRLGSATWGQQFSEAMSVNGGDLETATAIDYVMHFVTFAWKVLFAFVPPCNWYGGFLAFFVCLCLLGVLTTIIGDLASIFGCLIGLKKEVTAITFVALGTSLPDLFASKSAALNEKHADAAIGNVTGSNSVNVFLGLGTSWLIASIYHASKGNKFKVEGGSLSVSVVTYVICAIICVAILTLRRFLARFGKGELGGPDPWRWVTAVLIGSLWPIYVIISALTSYKKIIW
eukprot:gene9359-10346_t